MNILITGGGTEVDIDSVRSIKNFSKGTTASLLVQKFLELGHNVKYLVSESGKTPFQYTIDCYKNKNYTYLDYVPYFVDWCNKYKDFYSEIKYRTYEDYFNRLLNELATNKYDIVILAAAVSDFTLEKTEGKNSSLENLFLSPTIKVIQHVKTIQPDTFLVGFKLLCNASDIELAAASYTSIIKNGCDMVVANNMSEVGKRVVCFRQDLKVADSNNSIQIDGSYLPNHTTEFIVKEIIENKARNEN